MKKRLPGWAVLLIITLVAGIALGITDNLTRNPIQEQERIQAENNRKAVLPAADTFEELELPDNASVNWVYQGLKDGAVVGYVSQISQKGFGSIMDITVGADADGVISGVRIGGSGFAETPGLGANAKKPKFYEQFAGKEYPVDLKKYGGEIDAISSATVTSSSVVSGVNSAVKDIAKVAGFQLNEPAVLVEELGDHRYSIQAKGLTGSFDVIIGTDDSGAVNGIEIGDPTSDQDIPFLGKVKDNGDFLNSFIGTKSAEDIQPIDTVSGATVSSGAIKEAAGTILLYVNDPDAFAAQMTQQQETADVSIPEGAVTYTVQEKGYTGTFDVTVGIDENGAVNGIEIGEASSEHDAGFLNMVKNNNAFLAKFIGVTGAVKEDEVDAVAGATVSSKGVIAAVNDALSQAAGGSEPVTVEKEPDQGTVETIDTTPEPVTPAATEAPAPTAEPTAAPVVTAAPAAPDDKAPPVDGGNVQSGESMLFFTTVKADVSFEDCTITDVTLSGARVGGEYAPLEKSQQFSDLLVGMKAPVNADALRVSGVPSYVSTAVTLAVNEAYGNAVSDAVQAQPESTEIQPVDTSRKSSSGYSLIFFSAVWAEAAFDGDTLSDFTLQSSAAGENAWEPMDQEQEYLEALIGKAMPLSDANVRVTGTAMDSAVMIALNEAYSAIGDRKDTAEMPEQPVTVPAENDARTSSGDSLIFFHAVRASASFVDDTLHDFTLKTGAIAANVWWVTMDQEQEQEYLEALIGKAMPLSAADVRVTGGPLDSAVMIALNEAYAAWKNGDDEEKAAPVPEEETSSETIFEKPTYTGESMIFFERIVADGAFEDGKVVYVSVRTQSLNEEADPSLKVEIPALQGEPLPLDPNAYSFPGFTDYEGTAIVVAVNQAYEQYLAGQQ